MQQRSHTCEPEAIRQRKELTGAPTTPPVCAVNVKVTFLGDLRPGVGPETTVMFGGVLSTNISISLQAKPHAAFVDAGFRL